LPDWPGGLDEVKSKRKILKSLTTLLLGGFAILAAAPASADWTPWQTIQGDAAQGLDMSTNSGSLDYGGGAHKVLIRYRNRYNSAFRGVVVLEVHDADGKVRLVNDSLNLQPSAEDSGTASPEIASIVKPTSVRQESEQPQHMYGNFGIGGGPKTITPPPSEITFPAKWADWQPVSQATSLALRRTTSASNGVFNYEIRNDSGLQRLISWHYEIPGGGTMSDSLIVPAHSVRSLQGIASSSIIIDSVK
jgi:hypothetical protein